MVLETKRLIIRDIKLEDSKEVFNYRSDVNSNKYQSWIPKTINDVTIFIEKCAKIINQKSSWYQLVIIKKDLKLLIGDIGLHFLSDNQTVEIGCTLNKQYHHKNFATEALFEVIRFLFYDLNKSKIIASVDPENIASIKLLEKLKFKQKKYKKNSIYSNGKWVDDMVYSLLKETYK